MMAKRIISTFLAVLMFVSTLTLLVGAEEGESTFTPQYNTTSATPTMYYMGGRTDPQDTGNDPTSKEITKPEDKLATMDLRLVKDGYELYVDAYSGEIAVRCTETGEILFSNPYNIGASKSTTASIKLQLLSQVIVKYKDITLGDENTYYSGEWTVGKGIDTTNGKTLAKDKIQTSQLVIKNIKNGLRVEYTIGREQSKMLVPQQIEKNDFETKILNVMKEALTNDEDGYTAEDDFTYRKMTAYYSLKDLSTMTSEAAKAETIKAFPITEKMAVYVLDSQTTTNEMAKIEQYIKTYCPNYSYEDLDEDHLKTEFESEDENPPLFKLALEYTLDEQGLSVRLPANGIRFNESLYELLSIEILPYMGAGTNPNPGYTFFPDGSGALFDFEKIAALGTSTTVTGKVYGQDYAYHTITGTHQEIIRYPVFGLCETETFEATSEVETTEKQTYTKDRGFVAVVEEGDALMELSSFHAVRTSPYNTVRMIVYPRPQDTYNVADAISVGQNSTWTVVSSRKYTGNYKVRYIMLTDSKVAADKGISDYYECSYVGMAKAYRDYLESNGTLTRLKDSDVSSDIPLYIETFGALQTTEKFLSIPIDVMTPLTTFADIKTMYDDLADEGVTNVNFIMTGYTKGGMTSPRAPYHLKWESATKKGGMDFEELTAYAKEQGFQLFPDFDFVFIKQNTMFDGVSLKKHAVKTIDNRYTSKREYSATKQTYISYFELALSPAYFSHFYEKFTKNYLKYDPIGISVSTLGSYLNSDFDEDEPYNREDGKDFTVKAFEYLAENYNKVMTAGGNAYCWKYVDYITDIALDSSRFSQAAASVPFLGIVLHGYVEIAGTPINMEGNLDYAMLKAMENGASLKFILSYQNTENLKDYETLSKYYSVRYDIWFEDMLNLYRELNEVLKDLQTSVIVDHKFLDGVRIPDDDELEADAKAALEAAIKEEKERRNAEKEALRKQLLSARVNNPTYTQNVTDAFDASNPTSIINMMTTIQQYAATINLVDELETRKNAFETADAAYNTAKAELDAMQSTDPNYAAKQAEVETLKTARDTAEAAYAEVSELEITLDSLYTTAADTIFKVRELMAGYEEMKAGYDLIVAGDYYTAAIRDALKQNLDNAAAAYDALKLYEEQITGIAQTAYGKILTAFPETTRVSFDKYLEEKEGGNANNGENEGGNSASGIETQTTDTKYASDSNKIVYEVFENGTILLLNFNNYAVSVTLDNGEVYTIGAYGYIVLKKN